MATIKSIEEKAKRYDEAIEKFDVILNLNTVKESGTIFADDVRKIFPELVESEDERIRKEIIYYLKNQPSQTIATAKYDSWLNWLYKQTNQKLTIFIPKFRVGDKLVSTKNPRLTYEILEVGHINELGNPEYKVEIFTDGKVSNPRNIHDMECYKVDEWAKLIDSNSTEWSEEDKKMIGNIRSIIEKYAFSQSAVDVNGDLCEKEYIDADYWLKSLIYRYTWKPSDEQLRVLRNEIPYCKSANATSVLESLYNDLKKLREE